MDNIKTPRIGTTCPALTNENYETHLSGDCSEFCICILNNRACTGRIIQDFDNDSSTFFSRAKCKISENGLKKCPVYGISKETFKMILSDKTKKELDDKMQMFN